MPPVALDPQNMIIKVPTLDSLPPPGLLSNLLPLDPNLPPLPPLPPLDPNLLPPLGLIQPLQGGLVDPKWSREGIVDPKWNFDANPNGWISSDDTNMTVVRTGPDILASFNARKLPGAIFPGRMHGMIKSYQLDKGFGFISCDKTRTLFQRDVFIHRKEMTRVDFIEPQNLVGTPVTFLVQLQQDGHPQALSIRLEGDNAPEDVVSTGTNGGRDFKEDHFSFDPATAHGMFQQIKAAARVNTKDQMAKITEMYAAAIGMGDVQASLDKQPLPVENEAGAEYDTANPNNNKAFKYETSHETDMIRNHDPARRYIGVVNSFKETAGFGFVTCPQAFQVYGRDVFLHRSQVGFEVDAQKKMRQGFTSVVINVGDKVSFQVEVNRGLPKAKNAEIVDATGKAAEVTTKTIDKPVLLRQREEQARKEKEEREKKNLAEVRKGKFNNQPSRSRSRGRRR